MYFVSRDKALAEIPDSPSTLEFRSVALEEDSTLVRSGGGLLLVDRQRTLGGAIGPVVEDDAVELFRTIGEPREVLADRPAFEVLKTRYPFVRATIARLEGDWKPPRHPVEGLEIRLLGPHDSRDHLPDELFGELKVADCPILAGFIDGISVSFAYCASATETFADISIDTLEAYRRRGLASAVVSCLIDDIIRGGKNPVWGALDDNLASLGLAASLGFTRPAGELFVHEAE